MKPGRIIGLASLLLLPYTVVKTQSVPVQKNNRPNAGRRYNGTLSSGRFSQQPTMPDRRRAGLVQLSDHQLTVKYNLSGESLTIGGNNNDVQVRGRCGTLTITGSGNVVYVESVAGISTIGHRNEVIWRTGNPAVTNTGNGNNIVSRE